MGTDHSSRGSPVPWGCHPPLHPCIWPAGDDSHPRRTMQPNSGSPCSLPCRLWMQTRTGPLSWISAFTNQCNSSSFNGVMLTHSNMLQRVCYSTSMSSKKDIGPEIVSSQKRRGRGPCLYQLQPPTSKVPSMSLLMTHTPGFWVSWGCQGAPSCVRTRASAMTA